MSIVSSTTVIRSGTTTKRVDYIFIDHLGKEHKRSNRVNSYVNAPSAPENDENTLYDETFGDVVIWNGSAWVLFRNELEINILNDLAEDEYQDYLNQLKNGTDIFSLSPEHQDSITMFSRVLNEVVQLDVEQFREYQKGIYHITGLNKPTSESYGMDWTNFSSWKSGADGLKVALDNFTPLVV